MGIGKGALGRRRRGGCEGAATGIGGGGTRKEPVRSGTGSWREEAAAAHGGDDRPCRLVGDGSSGGGGGARRERIHAGAGSWGIERRRRQRGMEGVNPRRRHLMMGGIDGGGARSERILAGATSWREGEATCGSSAEEAAAACGGSCGGGDVADPATARWR